MPVIHRQLSSSTAFPSSSANSITPTWPATAVIALSPATTPTQVNTAMIETPSPRLPSSRESAAEVHRRTVSVLIPISVTGWLLFGVICILCINGQKRKYGWWLPEWYCDRRARAVAAKLAANGHGSSSDPDDYPRCRHTSSPHHHHGDKKDGFDAAKWWDRAAVTGWLLGVVLFWPVICAVVGVQKLLHKLGKETKGAKEVIRRRSQPSTRGEKRESSVGSEGNNRG